MASSLDFILTLLQVTCKLEQYPGVKIILNVNMNTEQRLSTLQKIR